MWYVVILALGLGFYLGVLFGRKNPKTANEVADKSADIAEKIETKASSIVSK